MTYPYNATLTGSDRPTELHDYPIVHIQPVAWGEMDAFNHVNNVAYYRYAESARISYLHALAMLKGETLTILAGSSCNYLRPVHYPDTLLIGVKCTKIGNTSLSMAYEYYSTSQQAIVANGTATIVRTDKDGNKQVWTADERQILSDFEGCSL